MGGSAKDAAQNDAAIDLEAVYAQLERRSAVEILAWATETA